MREAHEKGSPVMRPLFYDFPEDKAAWEIDDQYMFGPDILVAPVMYAGMTISVDAPIEQIPVFVRKNNRLADRLGIKLH